MVKETVEMTLRRAEEILERVPPPVRWAADLMSASVVWTFVMVALLELAGILGLLVMLGAWVFAAVILWRTLRSVFGPGEMLEKATRYLVERARDDSVTQGADRREIPSETLAGIVFPRAERRRAHLAAVVTAGPPMVFLFSVLPSIVWLVCVPVAVVNLALIAVLLVSQRWASRVEDL